MMLGRTWASVGAAIALAAGCGGTSFEQGVDAMGGGAGQAGQNSGATAGGGASSVGMSSSAGEPGIGGEIGEGGATGNAGAPSTLPSIVIVQASRTSLILNMDPSMTLTKAPAAGNALIVGITCFTEVENCVIPEGGVSDNHGNIYALVMEGASIVSSNTHGSRGYLFIAENIAAPASPLTISVDPLGMPSDSFQNFAWGVLEVSGLVTSGSVDQTGSFPNTCCFPSTTVSTDGATTQPNELAVAIHTARSNDNDFSYGHDPAWVEHHLNDDGQSIASQHSLVTRILSEPGVVSHTWTHHEPTRGVSAIIATFRGARE